MQERIHIHGNGIDASTESTEWMKMIQHRLLGTHRGDESGPTMVIIAALHGNEISGSNASLRVFNRLQRKAIPFRGQLTALIGNVPAYDAGLRFIEEDLNRIWTRSRVESVMKSRPVNVEETQMLELLQCFNYLSLSSDRQKYMLDLHTTSAVSPPFAAHTGDLHARNIVRRFGAVEVQRITDYLNGMLIKYVADQGWTSIVFEAGSHHHTESVDIHEMLIWHSLAAAEMIDEEDIPTRIQGSEALLQHPETLSAAVEVVHHHTIKKGDQFRMRQGYRNFQSISRGELLAEDRNGPINAPINGRIFLPLYQNEGQDGFFIVQDLGNSAHEDAA